MSKQLQEQRNQLVRDLYAAEDRLSAMEGEYTRAKQREQNSAHSHMPNEGPANRVQTRVVSESGKLATSISSLQRDISDQRRVLADLDRAISFGTEVEQAEASHQEAVAASEQAQETLNNLRGSRKELAARLEQLRTEAEQRLYQAAQDERSSAEAYTEALKSGSTDTSQAGEKMRQSSVALAAAKQEHAGKQQVFEALESELSALDKQIAAAECVAGEAGLAVQRAIAIKLGIAWDKQVNRIVSLGNELLAARKAAGLPVDGLRDINIPRFSTYRAKAIGVRELEEAVSKRIA